MKVKNAKRIISIMLAFMLTLVFAVLMVVILEFNKEKDHATAETTTTKCSCGAENIEVEFNGKKYKPFKYDEEGNLIIPKYNKEDGSVYDMGDALLEALDKFVTVDKQIQDYHDWYIIDSVESWKTFACASRGYYLIVGEGLITDCNIKLTADLDFIDKVNDKNYEDWAVYQYKATFDGQGHKISNFNVDSAINYKKITKETPRCPIFIEMESKNATIKNLEIDNFFGGAYKDSGLNDLTELATCGQIFTTHTNNDLLTLDNIYVHNYNIVNLSANGIHCFLIDGSLKSANLLVKDVNLFNNVTLGTDKKSHWFSVAIGNLNSFEYKIENSVIVKDSEYKNVTFIPHDGKNFDLDKNVEYSNVKTEPKDTENLDCNSKIDGKTTWYYNELYNDGYPMLRSFIDWQDVQLTKNIENAGSLHIVTKNESGTEVIGAEVDKITIPSDFENGISISNPYITIMGQKVIAKPKNGYTQTTPTWDNTGENEYTANFTLNTYTLTFANAIGTSGDTIQPSPSTTYTVQHGSTILASHTSGDDPFTLTYGIDQPTASYITVTYDDIPAKYRLTSAGAPETITGTTTITPTVELKTYIVKIYATTDAKREIASWTVKYDEDVTYNSNNKSFTYNGETITYTPNTGYRFESIKQNGNTTSTPTLNDIKRNHTIELIFMRWYTVTFKAISNTSQPTSNQTIDVKNNESITITPSADKKELTYSYGKSSVTYRANEYYIVKEDGTTLTNVNRDGIVVTPSTEFYACKVTMQNNSKDDKDSNKAMAEMSVTGDNYETVNDGIFAVNFNESVSVNRSPVSGGKISYIYTFTSGQTVTYTTTDEKYEINSYDLHGKEEYSFNDKNERVKTISPTFKVKQYKLKIIVDKDDSSIELLNDVTLFHGSTFVYVANLSLTTDSKFEYSYTSLYNSIESAEIKYSGYFVEHFLIRTTEFKKEFEDGKEIDITNIEVKSNIDVRIYFLKMWKIEFLGLQGEGIKDTSTLNGYTNPMYLREGSKIEVKYPPSTKDKLIYSVTYNADNNEKVEDVFKYVLKQYYRCTDTQGIDSLNKATRIKPTIEFFACKVTMGEISSSMGTRSVTGDNYNTANDGIFVVEFGTTVEFAYSQTGGKFTYVYRFSTGQKVTYTITDNKYAMASRLDEIEGRIWFTKLYSDGETTKDNYNFYEFNGPTGEERPTPAMQGKTINPTFGLKSYNVELG